MAKKAKVSPLTRDILQAMTMSLSPLFIALSFILLTSHSRWATLAWPLLALVALALLTVARTKPAPEQ